MKLNVLSAILAILLILGGLSACKNKTDESTVPTTSEQAPDTTEKTPKPEDTTDYEALLNFQFKDLTDTPVSEFLYTVANNAVTVMGYADSDVEKIRVPESIDGAPVVAIADGAFANLTKLKVLFIPDCVTVFGKDILKGSAQLYALRTPFPQAENTDFLGYLYGASNYQMNNTADLRALDFLEIGGTITRLPSNALYDCNDLVALKLPSTLTVLGDYSLYRCESLKYLNTDQLVTIESHAMDFCLSIEKLSFSATLKSVGLGAFENCHSLRRLTLPFLGGSATENTYLGYIFGAAHYNASSGFYPLSLESVNITNGVTEIPAHAFYDCDSLLEVNLPDSVTSIGVRAFSFCTSLVSLNCPDALESIGDSAFANCSALKEIHLGNTLQKLGTNAFLNCSSLTEISLPSSLTTIPNSCFYGCTSLRSINLDHVTSIGKHAFYGCVLLEDDA